MTGSERAAEAKYHRERLAYHEAGHAVVGLLYGWSIESIELLPAGGCVRFRRKPMDRSWPAPLKAYHRVRLLLYFRQAMAIGLAGPISEAEFVNRPHEAVIVQHEDLTDLLEFAAHATVRSLCARYDFPALTTLIDGTIHTVIRPAVWRRIEHLAEALMRAPCLTGHEVLALLSATGAKGKQLPLFDETMWPKVP